MKKSFAGVVAALALMNLALAQDAPKGAPPTLKVVASIDKEKGQIVYIETIVRLVPVQRAIVETVNGQAVKKVVTEYVSEYVQEMRVTQIANSRVITPDGKQMPIDEVWKRLAKGTVIAISGDGNQPAQAYLRALNPEILIIIPGPPKNVEPKRGT